MTNAFRNPFGRHVVGWSVCKPRIAMLPQQLNRLDSDRNGSGSVLFHYAVVKSQAGDKASSGILFEQGGDVEAELAEIAGGICHKSRVVNREEAVFREGSFLPGPAVIRPPRRNTPGSG